MKKLEDKILNKVYMFETKKTLLNAFIKTISVCMLTVATGTFAFFIFQTFDEKETLSVIDIFQVNMQTLHTYLLDVTYIIVTEIPKLHALFFVIGVLVLGTTLWVLAKNFHRILNKTTSLIHYWIKERRV